MNPNLRVTDGWEDRWVKSKFKGSDEGPWELSAGKYHGDADDKGNACFCFWFLTLLGFSFKQEDARPGFVQKRRMQVARAAYATVLINAQPISELSASGWSRSQDRDRLPLL